MAGIPPLIGFFSKQFVLYSAVESGYYFISIVAIIVSVISASYYLKVIRVIRVLHSNSELADSEQNLLLTNPFNLNSSKFIASAGGSMVTNFHSFLISTLTLSILIFVLKPSILLNSTQLLSLSLFYY